MKRTVAASLVALCMGVVLGIAVYPRWQHSRANEVQPARVDAQTALKNLKRETDEDVLASTAQLAELRFGTGAGSLYIHCHLEPPIDSQHQAKCKTLDDRMKRADEQDKKHPW